MLSARIHNFQSLKDVRIEVDGLTAITGQNNTGKSAIQRAILGALQNAPGSSFVRHNTPECKVTVSFQGQEITWVKSAPNKKQKPYYSLNGGDPIYPGRELPEEVTSISRVLPITVNGESLWPNIASQFTGQVFLLDRAGSALAEAISDVNKVSRINKALSLCTSDANEVRSTAKLRRVDKELVDAELSKFEGWDEVAESMAKLESLDALIQKAQNQLSNLVSLKLKLEEVQERIAFLQCDVVIPDGEPEKRLLSAMERALSYLSSWDKVRKDLSSYIEVVLPKTPDLDLQEIQLLEVLSSRWKSLPVIPSISVPDQIFDLTDLECMCNWKESLAKISFYLQDDGFEKDVELAHNEVHALLKESGECPTCGTVVIG